MARLWFQLSTNMIFQATEGSSPLCHFSLRPPLPKAKTDGREEPSLLNPTSVAETKLPFRVSFLFRMFIACHILRLGPDTRFTSLVLLHRYVQAKQDASTNGNSNADNQSEDWPWIGAICLFLACKTEDEPRRLRDIINMVHMVLSDRASRDDSVILLDMTNTPPLDDAYWESKQKAVETEQMVLRWLGFDSFVSHPHRAVYWILEQMIDHKDESIRDKIFENSSQHLNDALFYPRALQWGAIEMACASIDLAVAEQNEADTLKSIFKSDWWTRYDVSKEDFSQCRKSLVEATCYLKSLDRSTIWFRADSLALGTWFLAISRHVIGIIDTFPTASPPNASTVFVYAGQVNALITRFSTIDGHVIHIVLALALRWPKLTFGLDASIVARQRICTVGILVLATAIPARILAIHAHIGFVPGTLALNGPIGTRRVFIGTSWLGRTFCIAAKTARLFAIYIHVIGVVGAFALASPKGTFGQGTISELSSFLASFVFIFTNRSQCWRRGDIAGDICCGWRLACGIWCTRWAFGGVGIRDGCRTRSHKYVVRRFHCCWYSTASQLGISCSRSLRRCLGWCLCWRRCVLRTSCRGLGWQLLTFFVHPQCHSRTECLQNPTIELLDQGVGKRSL